MQKEKEMRHVRYSPMLGERGEAQAGDIALLAVSDKDPGGDELIWTGATAPSTTNTRKEKLRACSQVQEVGRGRSLCCCLKDRTKTENVEVHDSASIDLCRHAHEEESARKHTHMHNPNERVFFY